MQDQVNATHTPKRVPWKQGQADRGKAAAATQTRLVDQEANCGKIPEVSRDSPLHDAIELIGRELCEHVAFCGVGVVTRDFSLTVDNQSPL